MTPNAPSVCEVIASTLHSLRHDLDSCPNGRPFHDRDFIAGAAVEAALKAMQPEHVVDLREDTWHLQHSMACRLEGRLLDCPVDAAIREYFADGPGDEVGWRWVVAVGTVGPLDLIERVCKVCGCTDRRACLPVCTWSSTPSVCSRCTS